MLSPTPACPASDAERRATLVRVYTYLIEKGRQRKKQSIQSEGAPQPESLLPTAPLPIMGNEPECPHA
jgi:hypothetical protein